MPAPGMPSWARHAWARHACARHAWARHTWARHAWARHACPACRELSTWTVPGATPALWALRAALCGRVGLPRVPGTVHVDSSRRDPRPVGLAGRLVRARGLAPGAGNC